MDQQKLGSCRARGQWTDVLALRRKKHSAFEAICLAEAEFNLLLEALPTSCHDVGQAGSPRLLDRSKVSGIVDIVAAALPRDQSPALLMGTVLLARVDLECGDAAACAQKLKTLPNSAITYSTSDPSGEYGKVIILMYHVTLGLALQRQGDYAAALQCFQAANNAIESLGYVPPSPSKILTSRADLDQWMAWSEEVIFGLFTSSLKLGQPVHDITRRYCDLMRSAPPSFRQSQRAAVYRHMILSILEKTSVLNANPQSACHSCYIHTTIPDPLTGVPFSNRLPERASITPQAVVTLRPLLQQYEASVTELLPFPRGEDSTEIQILRHERVLEVYDLWGLLETQPLADESPSEIAERHCRYIETLYRGTKHTFQSLKLLRNLAHVFGSLLAHSRDSACSDERGEAEAVVEAYSHRFSKSLGEVIKLEKKKRDESSADPESDPIAVPGAHGETIADAVGVLITATRILIGNSEGDFDKLKKAVDYAELAMSYIRDHGSLIPTPEMPALLQRAAQNLGIAYGELAQEVSVSEERVKLQGLAVQALKDASTCCMKESKSDKAESSAQDGDNVEDGGAWDVDYQLALQLAENGEIADAFTSLNRSLTMNSSHGPSWNLLALLLSTKKDYAKASDVCDVAWNEILAGAVNPVVGVENTDEVQFSWDSVCSEVKEDLINLRLTQLVIDFERLGPKAALDSLHSIFALFRKLFGAVNAAMDLDQVSQLGGENGRASVDIVSSDGRGTPAIGNSQPSSARPHSRGSTGGSSSYPFGGPPAIYGTHSFHVYNLQICLWLSASALYRQLNRFEEARAAVAQAESVAEILARFDGKTKERPSRIFRQEKGGASVASASSSLSFKKTKQTSKRLPLPPQVKESKKWGLVDPGIRRVLADIMFESSMIKYAEYRESLKQENADGNSNRDKVVGQQKVPTAKSNRTVGADAVHTSRRQSTITISRSIASVAGAATPPLPLPQPGGDGFLNNANGSGRSVPDSQPPSSQETTRPVLPVLSPPGTPPDISSSSSSNVLAALISEFFLITMVDDNHLATRVHLAELYRESHDLVLAEYWFERACKRSRARGCGGGRPGISSIYGGLTGRMGWEGWAGLGRVLKETRRMKGARECLFFAIRLRRICPARGFECLRRL